MKMAEGGSDFGEVMELHPELSNMRFTGSSGHTVITSTPHCSEVFKQTAYEKMCLTNDSGFGDTSSLSHSPFPITTNVQIRRRLLESCTSDWDSSQIESPFFGSPDVNTLSLHVDMDVESETGRHQEKCLNDSPDIDMKNFTENFNSVMKSVSPIETKIEFDRVIGRKMGLEKLDIMTELHIRNVHPVSDVLMQLHPEDLCRWVASNLKNDEKLQHCPRCGHPAKILPVQDRGLCQSKVCCFDYCTICLADFHNAKQCKSLIGKKNQIDDTIGSKKCRKNLKRL
ncbi:hypothetical protein ACJMK2_004272 [Sinanodonta woodiana]|uniref:ZBR-type domain-containing protein n=1 Tax=Sinanodonta woodiana TaxID=1069815 RepID=A0ABD3Y1A2_SINWO